MLRRWCIPLAVLAVALAPALAAGSASAATHPGTAMTIRAGGTALNRHGGIRNEEESTNWSGYAADSGTYTSVSASWVEPKGTCTSATRYSSFWVGLDIPGPNSFLHRHDLAMTTETSALAEVLVHQGAPGLPRSCQRPGIACDMW
jgi:hypothetical protein